MSPKTKAAPAAQKASVPAAQIDDFLAWLKKRGIDYKHQAGATEVEVFACGGWVKLQREGHCYFGPAEFRPTVSRFIRERMDAGLPAPAGAAARSDHLADDMAVWDDFAIESPLRLADMPGGAVHDRVANLAKYSALYADCMLEQRRMRSRVGGA